MTTKKPESETIHNVAQTLYYFKCRDEVGEGPYPSLLLFQWDDGRVESIHWRKLLQLAVEKDGIISEVEFGEYEKLWLKYAGHSHLFQGWMVWKPGEKKPYAFIVEWVDIRNYS